MFRSEHRRLPSLFCFRREQRRLLVWESFERLSRGEGPAWLEGTGEESRDYLTVEDVAAAFLQLAEQRLAGTREGGSLIVNVASGQETKVLALIEMMRDIIAPGKEIRFRGVARKGDPKRWRADISRLRSVLPTWQPRPLKESLVQCIAEWQKESRVSKQMS